MKTPPNYEIPEDHAAILRTMLSMPVEDAIPQQVTDRYYAIRRCLDRTNCGFPTEMLAVVAVGAGVIGEIGQDKEEAEQPASIDWSSVKPGALVVAGQRAGRFLGIESRGRQGRRQSVVRVQFDDGPQGVFDASDVRFAESEAAVA